MDRARKVTNERVDDTPLLLAYQNEMGVAELINEHFAMHGHWQGASAGAITQVWLSFILSEGDHRLNQVEAWYEKRAQTIGHYVPEALVRNDFRDDRLAIILKALSCDATWSAFEAELNQRTIRVYDLSVEQVRLDTTTASGHWQITEDGLFQYGHSKDYRPDLPQLKVMLATLDPLGMPLVTQVVSGNRADDPLYLPAIETVRASLNKSGILYTGDAKMAALGVRAAIEQADDYYLCPLPAVQMPPQKLRSIIEPALQGEKPLLAVNRIEADGELVQLADAFEQVVEQTNTVDGEQITWYERQIVARSTKYQQSQTKSLQTRLYWAQEEINALNERKQGKAHLTTYTDYELAVAKILAKRQVAGLLNVTYQTAVHERHVQKYRDRPERIERTEERFVTAVRDEDAIDSHRQTLGWRVYVTNAPADKLTLQQAIIAYREQFTEERAFGRLKGKPLSLTPMYLEKDDHATGLVRLLSIGLRILSLMEFSLRRALQPRDTPLVGLYAGNPKRTTKRPTAEKILAAFKDIILTIIHESDSSSAYLTPLSDTQSHILHLLGFDDSLYLSLSQNPFPKPPFLLHEP